MVTNERLRYIPEKSSRLDKTLKRAEGFAKKLDKILSALKLIGASTYDSSALFSFPASL
jgi:bacterioferritin (cytochrome b1)